MNAVMDTIATLQACQRALSCEDEQVVASAESVVSYVVVHLRHRKAPIPEKLKPHLDRVMKYAA